MRNLLLLLLIVIALVLWSRSRQSPAHNTPVARVNEAGSSSGGPVRQWEHEPDAMMAREGALPQPGSGVAPKAMLDAVRHGLQNSVER